MAADMEKKIENLINLYIDDYQGKKVIDKIKIFEHPDRAKVIDILEKLQFEIENAASVPLTNKVMIDSVEDYWDVVHIMNRGEFAATRHNVPGETHEQSLEELFFSITGEGKDE